MVLGYEKKFADGRDTPFVSAFIDGTKIHTFRPDKRNQIKAGTVLKHVINNRTPQIHYFGQNICNGTQNIVIVFNELGKIESVKVDGKEQTNWEVIAKNDGLNILDFESYFYNKSQGGVFKSKIIHFTDLRY